MRLALKGFRLEGEEKQEVSELVINHLLMRELHLSPTEIGKMRKSDVLLHYDMIIQSNKSSQ